MTTTTRPTLPSPYTEGPNESAEEQDAWVSAINNFITHLVICDLDCDTTAEQLFEPFTDRQHQPLLFYYACAALLQATRENTEAGEYVGLIAGLFARLKEEGLKRDGPNGYGAYGNAVVFPTLRSLLSDVPAPPGYKSDEVNFILVPDNDYVKDPDTHLTRLAEYAHAHQGLVRLWSLVGRLEADNTLCEPGPGAYSRLFHPASALLRALEDPLQRGVWETLWAALLRLEDDDLLSGGLWTTQDKEQTAFKDAARKIAEDETVPIEWRARFALREDAHRSRRLL
ncbi:hypothetical protein C8F01DRAFT_1101042 [Mycena amicta]|nr:hypothetical protein C8F01DRAFT_1101042 [Mycena amicta]